MGSGCLGLNLDPATDHLLALDIPERPQCLRFPVYRTGYTLALPAWVVRGLDGSRWSPVYQCVRPANLSSSRCLAVCKMHQLLPCGR